MAHQSIEDFKTFVLGRMNNGKSIDEIAEEVTDQWSKGFLELFPRDDNYRLWRLLIQRTLEYLGIDLS